MPNPVLAALTAEVTETTTVMESATVLINGIATRVQAAIDKAVANGATEAELAPVQAEVDALHTGADNLSAAIVANTPAE